MLCVISGFFVTDEIMMMITIMVLTVVCTRKRARCAHDTHTIRTRYAHRSYTMIVGQTYTIVFDRLLGHTFLSEPTPVKSVNK